MDENAFEGMGREEFQMLALQLHILQVQARLSVLEELTQQLFEQAGQKEIGGMPISDYVLAMTKKAVPKLIALTADFDPKRATKLSKMLEAVERGHV